MSPSSPSSSYRSTRRRNVRSHTPGSRAVSSRVGCSACHPPQASPNLRLSDLPQRNNEECLPIRAEHRCSPVAVRHRASSGRGTRAEALGREHPRFRHAAHAGFVPRRVARGDGRRGGDRVLRQRHPGRRDRAHAAGPHRSDRRDSNRIGCGAARFQVGGVRHPLPVRRPRCGREGPRRRPRQAARCFVPGERRSEGARFRRDRLSQHLQQRAPHRQAGGPRRRQAAGAGQQDPHPGLRDARRRADQHEHRRLPGRSSRLR